MNGIKKIWQSVRWNWKTIASFEILFKLVSAALLTPLFKLLFAQVMRLSGLRYLTAENVSVFLKNPFTWIILIPMTLLFACFELFEFGGLIYMLDQSRKGRRFAVGPVFLFTFRRMKKLSGREYVMILPRVLLLTPAFHLPTFLNLLWSYSVFDRLLKLVRRRWYFLILVCLAIFLFFSLFLSWRYLCHYFILEGLNAKQSARCSRRLGRAEPRWNILPVLGMTLLLTGAYLVLIAAFLLLSTGLQALFSLPGSRISTLQVIFINLMVSAFDAVNLPVLLAMISQMFYRCKKKRRESVMPVEHVNELTGGQDRRRLQIMEMVVLVSSLAVGVVYLIGISGGRYRLRIDGLRTMQVTAHRGASMYYPENTMAAFQGAVDQGTDWIELDVQESKDGQIFVMHDTNFKRTTGLDKNAWELTYEEILALDAGSFFNKDYAGERIPLLSEVVDFAKERGVRLNIELKPTGHEENLVGGVVDIVEEAGFVEDCVITSQAYRVVEEVKARNEEIETVYVMGLAYGAINRLTAADAFSIRSTSISQSLVRNLHNRGLEVYAWTVDSRNNINRMINLGVDNIITNNVPLAIECVNDSRSSSMILELIKTAREWLR